MNKSIVKTIVFLGANLMFNVENSIAHDVPQSEINHNSDQEKRRLLDEYGKDSRDRDTDKRVLKLESKVTYLSNKFFYYEAAFCLATATIIMGMRWAARNRYMYISPPPLSSWTRTLLTPRYIIPFGLTYAGYGLYKGQVVDCRK